MDHRHRKSSQSVTFVFENVKYREQFYHFQNFTDSLGRVQELHISRMSPHGTESTHEFANAAAVNVRHARQIQNDVYLSSHDQVPDTAAKGLHLTRHQPAAEIQDGDICYLPNADLHIPSPTAGTSDQSGMARIPE